MFIFPKSSRHATRMDGTHHRLLQSETFKQCVRLRTCISITLGLGPCCDLSNVDLYHHYIMAGQIILTWKIVNVHVMCNDDEHCFDM